MKSLFLSFILIFSGTALGASGFSISEPPENLGPPVNSESNDFSPTLSPDGSYMIFNSNRGGRYQNLYISYFKDGKWSEPEALTQVNSSYNDESPFLSFDGNTLIFSSDRDGSTEMPKNAQGQIRVSFDIYISKKTDGSWSTPRPLPGDVNNEHHAKSPSLSRDGRTLYYNLWPFGDISRAILAKAELKDGRFVNPQPMPEPFNQGFRDLGLIPAEDLGGFFFSSNRPDNIGTFDLYFVEYSDGRFGKPENLGAKVNSAETDIYLSRVDQNYYITSSRENGRFDIYSSLIFARGQDFDTRAIHFDFDKAEIKPESTEYLEALYGYLAENPEIKMEIIGHTDLHGDPEYNKELSLKRARAVKDHLVSKGLDPERFSVSGAGASRPVIDDIGPGIDELNRRTEFRIK